MMTHDQIKEQRKLCLIQLRLSKWQLIWNREHEIFMIENVDKSEMTKAQLAGNPGTEKVIAALDQSLRNKHSEIKYAQREIEELDKVIAAFDA